MNCPFQILATVVICSLLSSVTIASRVDCQGIPPAGERMDWKPSTPLQMVNIYSNEMLDTVTGEKQPACSGSAQKNTNDCKVLAQGLCEESQIFQFSEDNLPAPNSHVRANGTEGRISEGLVFFNGSGWGDAGYVFSSRNKLKEIEFRFNGTSKAPDTAGNLIPLQIKTLQKLTLAPAGGGASIDVLRQASVNETGSVKLRVSPEIHRLFDRKNERFLLAIKAECRQFGRPERTWAYPVYEKPDLDSRLLGEIVIKVSQGMNVIYRHRTAAKPMEVAWDPDFIQADFGYSFEFGHTVLANSGDWYELAACPIPRRAWVHLAGHSMVNLFGQVLELSEAVKSIPENASRGSETIKGNIVILSVKDGVVTFRPETPEDMPCRADEAKRSTKPLGLKKARISEFYDSFLHLKVKPAYPKGC